MSSFTSPLIVSPLSNGKYWLLRRPFTYRIGSRYSRSIISVPAGFTTDFASIPKFVFWLLPWWGKFNKSSVLHDWLYRVKQIMGNPITREEADDIWLEAMFVEFRHHWSGKFVAYTEYCAVRTCAWLAWKKESGNAD